MKYFIFSSCTKLATVKSFPHLSTYRRKKKCRRVSGGVIQYLKIQKQGMNVNTRNKAQSSNTHSYRNTRRVSMSFFVSSTHIYRSETFYLLCSVISFPVFYKQSIVNSHLSIRIFSVCCFHVNVVKIVLKFKLCERKIELRLCPVLKLTRKVFNQLKSRVNRLFTS